MNEKLPRRRIRDASDAEAAAEATATGPELEDLARRHAPFLALQLAELSAESPDEEELRDAKQRYPYLVEQAALTTYRIDKKLLESHCGWSDILVEHGLVVAIPPNDDEN